MSSARELKALEKRLNQLKNSLDLRKKKLDDEQKHIDKQKRDLKSKKSQLDKETKEVEKLKRQMLKEQSKRRAEPKTPTKRPVSGGQNASRKISNLEAELKETKSKLDHFQKESRTYIKKCQAQEDRIKVLERKLKNAQGKKERKDDKQLRHALRENKQLKKRLRQLIAELNKKRRWYQRVIKQFKNNNQRWIKKQQEAKNKRKIVIRYVFVDDIKKIKVYKNKNGKYRRGVRVRDKNGGEVIIKDVIIEDGHDEPVDELSKKRKGKKGKGKKNKRDNNNDDDDDDEIDDLDSFMDDLYGDMHSDTEGVDPGDEEIKTDDEEEIPLDDLDDVDDTQDDKNDNYDNTYGNNNNNNNSPELEAQVKTLTDELQKRNDDLQKLKDLMVNVFVNEVPPNDEKEEVKEPEESLEDDKETSEPTENNNKNNKKEKPKVVVKTVYKWNFYSPKKKEWIPFAKDISDKLEEAYSNDDKPNEVEYKIGKQTFVGKPCEDEPIQTNKGNGRDYKLQRVAVDDDNNNNNNETNDNKDENNKNKNNKTNPKDGVYRWEFYSPKKDDWVEMKEKPNSILEDARKNGDEKCEYKIGKYTFIGYPNLDKPKQTNTKDNNSYEIRKILVSPLPKEDDEEEEPEEEQNKEDTTEEDNNNEETKEDNENIQLPDVNEEILTNGDNKFENALQKLEAYNHIEENLNDILGNVNDRQNSFQDELDDNNYDGDISKESNDWGTVFTLLSRQVVNGKQNIERLKAIYEQYVKELNGRINDLTNINNLNYYNEDNKNKNYNYNNLKSDIESRHNLIINNLTKVETDKQYDNKDEIEVYSDILKTNNVTWDSNVTNSSNSFNNSIEERNNLINEIKTKYSEMQTLMTLIERLPATKLNISQNENNNSSNNSENGY